MSFPSGTLSLKRESLSARKRKVLGSECLARGKGPHFSPASSALLLLAFSGAFWAQVFLSGPSLPGTLPGPRVFSFFGPCCAAVGAGRGAAASGTAEAHACPRMPQKSLLASFSRAALALLALVRGAKITVLRGARAVLGARCLGSFSDSRSGARSRFVCRSRRARSHSNVRV